MLILSFIQSVELRRSEIYFPSSLINYSLSFQPNLVVIDETWRTARIISAFEQMGLFLIIKITTQNTLTSSNPHFKVELGTVINGREQIPRSDGYTHDLLRAQKSASLLVIVDGSSPSFW